MISELSVVIPTLNAAATIGATLESLTGEATLPREIIIADGGSQDATISIAAALGARSVASPPGRGRQLSKGAASASGRWYLFLHADTVLELGWSEQIGKFMHNPNNVEKAAYCGFSLDDDAPAARWLETLVAWRCRVLGLPYGDQGLLISAAFHDALGGFKPLTLMEDVDIIRRIGRHRLNLLDVAALTSAMRYRQSGYALRSLCNLSCVSLYFLGVPIHFIARIYG